MSVCHGFFICAMKATTYLYVLQVRAMSIRALVRASVRVCL